MRMLFLWPLLLLATRVDAWNATGSRVSIHIPFGLHHKEGEEHTKAQFGFQHHSGNINANVFYIETAKDPLCSEIDWSANNTKGYPTHIGSPFIIMAKSGGCSATTKVRRAQLEGAVAFVLAHDSCRCSDKPCTDKYGADGCTDEAEELMLNDGSAGDISIPSFLLYKVVANAVIDEVKKQQPVLMELTWGLKQPNVDTPPVHYSLWTTAHDPVLDIETYHNFKTISKALEPHAIFEPRFSIINGALFNCKDSVDGPCDHLCTNHGRYCAVHAWELSGHAVVNETLRRLCIWQHHGGKDSHKYWDYVLYHRRHCGTHQLFADEHCLKSAFDAVKIDKGQIDQCYSDTGGLDNDADNHLLQEQLILQERSGVTTLPALTLTGSSGMVHMLQDASSWSLFEGLCRHFWQRNLTTTPEVCYTCFACPNTIGCVEHGKCIGFTKPKASSKSKKRGHNTFWLLFVSIAVGGAYYCYKRYEDEGFGGGEGVLSGRYFRLSGEEA